MISIDLYLSMKECTNENKTNETKYGNLLLTYFA